jgi:hypothetical protein
MSGQEGVAIALVDVSGFFSDADLPGQAITYTATALPAGVTLNASTGILSGTPSAGAAVGSPYTVVVTATDNAGASATQSFTFGVVDLPDRLADYEGWTAGTNFTFDASTVWAGATGFSATGLPTGLAINAGTGEVTGTIENGTGGTVFTVTMTATGGPTPGSGGFTWTPLEETYLTDFDNTQLTDFNGTFLIDL